MAREITEVERAYAQELLGRARRAMCLIEDYGQEKVDRLCQAVAWAVANEKTFTRLSHMSTDESGLADRDARVNKRYKIMGILRDALRQISFRLAADDDQFMTLAKMRAARQLWARVAEVVGDPASGAARWTSNGRQADNAAIVAAGQLVFFLTTDAELIAIRRDARGFEPLRKYTVAESPTWAHPVITNGGMLIKDAAALALWSLP